MTLKEKLLQSDNRPAGFDYLRLVLAVSVIAWHSVIVCYGRSAETPFWTGHLRPLPMVILPAFFALSGFLIGGSLERNPIPQFLMLRAIRIFPALAVETVFSALILGPIFTTLALGNYFTDHLFSRYFLNLIGDVQFYLPGVFSGTAVNTQLWTVPYELECYVAVSVLAAISLLRFRAVFLAVVIGSIIALSIFDLAAGKTWPLDQVPPGRLLVFSFLCGVSIYIWRDKLPCTLLAGIIAAAASWFALDFPETVYLAAIPVAYLTIILGIQNPRRITLIKGADYSYGIYLYGFPIQKAIAYAIPGHGWLFNFASSLAVTGLLAAMSWHLVESRVLSSKGSILDALQRVPRLIRQFGSA